MEKRLQAEEAAEIARWEQERLGAKKAAAAAGFTGVSTSILPAEAAAAAPAAAGAGGPGPGLSSVAALSAALPGADSPPPSAPNSQDSVGSLGMSNMGGRRSRRRYLRRRKTQRNPKRKRA